METKGNGGPAGTAAAAEDVLNALNDLLQLNHDAIGAYDIAIEKLDDRDHASQISGFKLDHERHIRELNDTILGLGGSPKNEPHKTSALKEAMQNLGGMAGDKGALLAWRANELQVRTKYDNYASKSVHWSNDVKRLIDQHALDEERHYRWVADTLAALGVGSGEGSETHVLNRVREQAQNLSARTQTATGVARNRITDASQMARQKVASGTDTARARAADGLGRGARRLDELADRQAVDGGGAKEKAAGAAHLVADGMEAASAYVDPASGASLRADMESRVRASPLKSLLMLFGVGFVVGRILR